MIQILFINVDLPPAFGPVINKLFLLDKIISFLNGNLINSHSTRLPLDKGGANVSWKIMNNDRICNQTLHVIDEGIDTGPIITTRISTIPKDCILPYEINDYQSKDQTLFLKNFIINLKEKKKFKLTDQPSYLGTYNPRLETIKERISSYSVNTCPICFDIIENPTATKCCNHIFCFKCIATSLEKSQRCPMCRSAIYKHNLTIISKETIKVNQEEEGLPSKLEALIKIINDNKKGKFLIFSSIMSSLKFLFINSNKKLILFPLRKLTYSTKLKILKISKKLENIITISNERNLIFCLLLRY